MILPHPSIGAASNANNASSKFYLKANGGAIRLWISWKKQGLKLNVTIPYWDWTVDQNIPTWLQSFTPTVVGISDPNITFPITVIRTPGLDIPNLPPQVDVDTVMAKTDFTVFSDSLESGNFTGHPEFQTGMHDQVHVWVGGTMGQIPSAPADPMFWMHHANIDRIWSLWQKQNPNKNPTRSQFLQTP